MKKTTESFKEDLLVKYILPNLNFRGTRMVFPYVWDGEQRYVIIKLADLLKIVKWDRKKSS